MQETPQKLKVPTAKRVPRVHLLLLGASGVGKTALVNEWLKCGGDASACVGGAPGTGHSVGPDVAAVDVRLGPPFNAGVPLVVWDLPEEDVLAGSCFGPATSFCPDVCALVFDATDAESLRRACELRRRFLALLQGEQPRAPRPVSVASEAALLAASSPAATAASSAAPPPQQRRGHQRSISAVTAAANAARVPAFMAVGIAPAHPSSALVRTSPITRIPPSLTGTPAKRACRVQRPEAAARLHRDARRQRRHRRGRRVPSGLRARPREAVLYPEPRPPPTCLRWRPN
eukprot:TRINITY_DN1578_c0_g1_i1.p1 TRINITY_DN1578_c0_g1~~TRINITY_DN1578_c0_g1_i1.p1  ORF type:complete len:297 (-),score=47.51 TRINITY_DN1578_c0_g1_i1:59-922(-)